MSIEAKKNNKEASRASTSTTVLTSKRKILRETRILVSEAMEEVLEESSLTKQN